MTHTRTFINKISIIFYSTVRLKDLSGEGPRINLESKKKEIEQIKEE